MKSYKGNLAAGFQTSSFIYIKHTYTSSGNLQVTLMTNILKRKWCIIIASTGTVGAVKWSIIAESIVDMNAILGV